MNHVQLEYALTEHPESQKIWKYMDKHLFEIPKVKKNFATEITSWYPKLTNFVEKKIDEWEQMHNYKHKCTKGCVHCCKQPILILGIEKLIITTYMNEHNLQSYFDKVKETAIIISSNKLPPPPKLDSHSGIESYKMKYFEADITCPFLNNGECVIYPIRPTNCATYSYYGETVDCDNNPTPDFGVQFSVLEKWMMTQMFNYFHYNKKKAPYNVTEDKISLLPLAISQQPISNLRTKTFYKI